MRMNERFYIAAAAGVLLALQAQAATWNATADFSLAANPNGAWSYGYANAAGASNALMTVSNSNLFGSSGLNGWSVTANTVPCVAKNTSASTYYGWAPGVLGMHPNNPGATEHAVVTWTAPSNGLYQFTSSFTYVGGGGGVGPSVTKNLSPGTGVFVGLKSGVITNAAPVFTWNETLSLVAGETISWALNSAGINGSDSTVLSAEVTSLPTGVWDANTDFSSASATNVNGVWSYGWANSAENTVGLMDTYNANFGGSADLNSWSYSIPGAVPVIVKNNNPANTYYGWAPGKLGLHPYLSPFFDHAVIWWTAPSNGVYQVNASATQVGHAGSDGVDVSIHRNLTGSMAGSLWTADLLFGWEAYYDGVFSLTKGESIALAVGQGPANSHGSDSTKVEFTVTPLPLATPVLWDARADFSATTNANVNGVWSYEWANTSSGTTGLIANMDLNGLSNTGLNTWYVPGSGGLPDVMKNNSAGATYYGLQPGKLGMLPYISSATWNEAVIRWTAPYTGEFQFAAAWKRVGDWGAAGGDRMNAAVQTNFTGSLAGSLWTGYSNFGVPARWSGIRRLKAGESVAFVTGNGGANNYGSDTTQVDIFVSLVSKWPMGTLIRVY